MWLQYYRLSFILVVYNLATRREYVTAPIFYWWLVWTWLMVLAEVQNLNIAVGRPLTRSSSTSWQKSFQGWITTWFLKIVFSCFFTVFPIHWANLTCFCRPAARPKTSVAQPSRGFLLSGTEGEALLGISLASPTGTQPPYHVPWRMIQCPVGRISRLVVHHHAGNGQPIADQKWKDAFHPEPRHPKRSRDGGSKVTRHASDLFGAVTQ